MASGSTFAYVSNVDTYLYDTAAFLPSSSSVWVDAPFQDGGFSVPIRGSNAIHLRRTQAYDAAGNLTEAIDYGQVSGSTPVDRPIQTTNEWSATDTAWPLSVSALGREYRLKSAETKYLLDGGGAGPLLTASSGTGRCGAQAVIHL